ncbi:MAG: hypothetical protein ACREJB_13305 [Planctomycetaceae bacterium]
MATSLERTEPRQQYVDFDEYIAFQLQKTRSSIQLTDVLTAAAGIATLTIAYLLVFVVFDHWIVAGGFGYLTRALMLGGLVLAMAAWLVWKVALPYLRRVNALYAARMIERTEPGLKSNLLNLIDLERSGREVPPEIRTSIEKRAALALSQMDVDQAVDRRPLLRLSYALLVCVVAFCAYALLSPKKVSSSIWRALAPASAVEVATRTDITSVEPGDVELLAGRQLEVTVDLRGEAPETVALYYTTADHRFVDEPIELRAIEEGLKQYRGLIAGESGRGIRQDLSYRVVAGDDQTRDFRVTVVQPPSARVEEVRYALPRYMSDVLPGTPVVALQGQEETEGRVLSVDDAARLVTIETTDGGPLVAPLDDVRQTRSQQSGHIDAYEGTSVRVTATANMPVSSASIRFSDTEDASRKAEEIRMHIEDGTRLTAEWELKFRSDGSHPKFYRIVCRNKSGQVDPEPALQRVTIRPDLPPEIELLDPTGDLERPANAVVPLALRARDPDFKLRFVTLRVEKGGELIHSEPIVDEWNQQEYAGTHDFKLAPLNLQKGDLITFWIEARDNKRPFGNRKNTQRLNISITESVSEEEIQRQLQQERQQQQERIEDAQEPSAEDNPAQPEEQPAEQGGEPPNPADAQQPQDGQEAGAEQQPMNGQGDAQEQRTPGDSQNGAQNGEGENQNGETQQQEGTGEGDRAGDRAGDPEGAGFEEALRRLLEQQRQEQQRQEQQNQNGEPQNGERNGQPMTEPSGPDGPGSTEKPDSQPAGGNESDPSAEPGNSGMPPGDRPRTDSPQRPDQTGRGPQKDQQPQSNGDDPQTSEKTPQNAADGQDKQGEQPQEGTSGEATDGNPSNSNAESPQQGEGNKPADGDKSDSPAEKPIGTGSEEPADPSADARREKADGTETGPATAEDDPNADPTPAQNKIDRRPDEQPMTRPSNGDGAPMDDPNAKPSEGDGSSKPMDGGPPKPMNDTPPPSGSGEQTPGDPANQKNNDPNAAEQGTDSKTDAEPAGEPKSNSDSAPPGTQGDPSGAAKSDGNSPSDSTDSGMGGGQGGEKSNAGDSKPMTPPDSIEKTNAPQQPSGGEKPGSETGGQNESADGQAGQEGQKGSEPSDGNGKGKSGEGESGGGGAEGQGGEEASGKPSGSASGQSIGTGGHRSGAGSGVEGQGEGQGTAGSAQSDPEAANLEYAKEASNLVLKKLEDQLERGEADQELLEQLGWNQDDLRKFTDRLRRELSRPDAPQDPQAEARQRQFEEMLKSLNLGSTGTQRRGGSDRDRPSEGIGPRDLRVPPEYKELYEAFTRGMSRRNAGK